MQGCVEVLGMREGPVLSSVGAGCCSQICRGRWLGRRPGACSRRHRGGFSTNEMWCISDCLKLSLETSEGRKNPLNHTTLKHTHIHMNTHTDSLTQTHARTHTHTRSQTHAHKRKMCVCIYKRHLLRASMHPHPQRHAHAQVMSIPARGHWVPLAQRLLCSPRALRLLLSPFLPFTAMPKPHSPPDNPDRLPARARVTTIEISKRGRALRHTFSCVCDSPATADSNPQSCNVETHARSRQVV
jgi:hypothetical protein